MSQFTEARKFPSSPEIQTSQDRVKHWDWSLWPVAAPEKGEKTEEVDN